MAVVWSTAANTTLWCVLHGKSVLRGTFDAEATQVSEANASVRQVVNLTGQLRMKTDQWPLRMIKDQQANKMSLIRKPICHGETSLHRKKKKKKKKGKKKKKKERKKERKKENNSWGFFAPNNYVSPTSEGSKLHIIIRARGRRKDRQRHRERL